MTDIHGAVRRFLLSLGEVLTAGATTHADAVAVDEFARLASVLRTGSSQAEAAMPGILPVCRFWDEALDRAADGPAVLAGHLRALGPSLRWTQNPNYRHRPPDPAFLENYGYAVIAGPAGDDKPEAARPLVAADALAVGVLLLGPGTYYPAHHHPASEIYCIVSGDAEWRRGDTPWRRQPPGAVVHHAPNLSHATRARAEPLLAVYLWRGDLATCATLLEKDLEEN
ncbi:dimethylsulfonioproprionate lyase family protein [Rhodospirillaceae bacterium SYSU D60014]|uniref:dimethylsulfonioproprionate lyase family protein n=1 Tax=Virgifigura deserti TaxID=2268457 RepID=UPI000E670EBE